MVTLSAEFLLVVFFFLASGDGRKNLCGVTSEPSNCFILSHGGRGVTLFRIAVRALSQ